MPYIANLRDLSIYHVSEKVLISNSETRLKNIDVQYKQLLAKGFDTRKLPAYLFQALSDLYSSKELIISIHRGR